MSRQEILGAIETLSRSQGFYGRLLERLTDGTDESEYFLDELESQNFSDVVDMVMYLES